MTQVITYEEIREIKALAIIALCSDDYLMDKLILKGGSCIELAYQISARASKDIDFSTNYSFTKDIIKEITKKLNLNLKKFFEPAGYFPFDIKFIEKPPDPDNNNIHSGYKLTIKITTKENHARYNDSKDLLNKTALPVGKNNSRKLEIEISKHEYCCLKEKRQIKGHDIFVYSPMLIVFEKLRAICQSMKEYREHMGFKPFAKERARDFYDIERVNEAIARIDFKNNENRDILGLVFMAKNVPLHLLDKIKDNVSIHMLGAESVKSTELANAVHKNYQYYIDYVLDIVDQLEEFWIE